MNLATYISIFLMNFTVLLLLILAQLGDSWPCENLFASATCSHQVYSGFLTGLRMCCACLCASLLLRFVTFLLPDGVCKQRALWLAPLISVAGLPCGLFAILWYFFLIYVGFWCPTAIFFATGMLCSLVVFQFTIV